MGIGATWPSEKGPSPWQEVGTRWSLSFLPTQTMPWFSLQFLSQSAHAAGVTVPCLLLLLQLLLSPICLKLCLQNTSSGAAPCPGEVPTSLWCQGLARSVARNIPYPEDPLWGPTPAGDSCSLPCHSRLVRTALPPPSSFKTLFHVFCGHKLGQASVLNLDDIFPPKNTSSGVGTVLRCSLCLGNKNRRGNPGRFERSSSAALLLCTGDAVQM